MLFRIAHTHANAHVHAWRLVRRLCIEHQILYRTKRCVLQVRGHGRWTWQGRSQWANTLPRRRSMAHRGAQYGHHILSRIRTLSCVAAATAATLQSGCRRGRGGSRRNPLDFTAQRLWPLRIATWPLPNLNGLRTAVTISGRTDSGIQARRICQYCQVIWRCNGRGRFSIQGEYGTCATRWIAEDSEKYNKTYTDKLWIYLKWFQS